MSQNLIIIAYSQTPFQGCAVGIQRNYKNINPVIIVCLIAFKLTNCWSTKNPKKSRTRSTHTNSSQCSLQWKLDKKSAGCKRRLLRECKSASKRGTEAVYMCSYVCLRESVCLCSCVCKRDRERESVCVCVSEKERGSKGAKRKCPLFCSFRSF